ncbi:serine/threonine protein kinase [Labilithrix luteola]|uniref:Serine/threonine protein kinase n=1 Tax=Labilithrix luteola TaxID=1391654 RepID=A0A0K1PNC8_9BACT|nr:serine/threonine-protein kinase [Labilithrix luteola]AKU94614.1 serine/threonine protein kinase [Labilithrix luteola]
MIHEEIAAGGMATIHYGRLRGPIGFARTVAIKRLHPQFAKDPAFVAMFMDEARLTARIRHPNVAQTLDIVALDGELFIVMEYVHGDSLVHLLRLDENGEGTRVPLGVLSAIVCGVLHGLHAAHQVTGDDGKPLHLVHRDVSPQNVMVGADGTSRVIDFGIAKALGRVYSTREGEVRGKLAYMAPEQVTGKEIDCRTDVFAAGILLWESLTSERLFGRPGEAETLAAVLHREIEPPSELNPDVPPAVDEICLRALERAPGKRFQTAHEMAVALEASLPVASPRRVAEWVAARAGEVLVERTRYVARIETTAGDTEDVEQRATPAPLPPPSERTAPIETTASLSIDAPKTVPPPTPRRRGRWLIGAVAVLALVTGYLVRSSVSGTSTAPRAAVEHVAVPVPVSPPPAAASVVASPAVTLSAEAPAPDAGRARTVVAASHVAPKVSSVVPSSAGPSSAASSSAPRSSARATPTAPCTVRSYIDESGITHFVEECK